MKPPVTKNKLKRAINRFVRAAINESWKGQYPPGHEYRLEIDHQYILAKVNLETALVLLEREGKL